MYVENATGWEPLLGNAGEPPTPDPSWKGVTLVRMLTGDFRDYTSPTVVLNLPKDHEGAPSLKSIARNDKTGLYVMFADGAEKTSQGYNYGTLTSTDAGMSWSPTDCSTGCVVHPDKDDLNIIWNKRTGDFVDMQIFWRQNVSMKYCDSDPCTIARAVTAKTSADGVNWSPDIGAILPDQLDPPDLQFYRIRPFYIGNTSRIAAHTLLYSPGPPISIVGSKYGCFF